VGGERRSRQQDHQEQQQRDREQHGGSNCDSVDRHRHRSLVHDTDQYRRCQRDSSRGPRVDAGKLGSQVSNELLGNLGGVMLLRFRVLTSNGSPGTRLGIRLLMDTVGNLADLVRGAIIRSSLPVTPAMRLPSLPIGFRPMEARPTLRLQSSRRKQAMIQSTGTSTWQDREAINSQLLTSPPTLVTHVQTCRSAQRWR
jgi:hypothetical protein